MLFGITKTLGCAVEFPTARTRRSRDKRMPLTCADGELWAEEATGGYDVGDEESDEGDE